MIYEIEKSILSNWNLFEASLGERPRRLRFIVQNGIFHRHQTVIFYVFKDREKLPSCVGKFSNDRETNKFLKHEYNSITNLSNNLEPFLRDAIPRTYGNETINGRFGFFMEWIDFNRLNTSRKLFLRFRKSVV